MNGELWLMVPWANRYKVSDRGRVMSFCGKRPKLLAPRKDRDGYVSVLLSDNEGKRSNWKIHRLVMMLHQPSRMHKSLEVNHIDGDKENNRLANLEWINRSGNIKHRYRSLGQKAPSGMDNHRAKHDDSLVVKAREMKAQGWRVCDIARHLQVHPKWVSKVCLGKIRTSAQASLSSPDAHPSA